jgi:hypothetical protein
VKTLRQLIPASILAGRQIVVLVCYLDDSGKDPQNPITTLAGYIAREDAWAAFETDVEHWFGEFEVGVLHAKELHDTDGDFSGWSILRKQAFVARICQTAAAKLMMGLSMSVAKQQYRTRAEESDRKRTVTPYSFCFEVIVDWILRDYRLGALSNAEGVALILECGHENNPEAEQEFSAVRKLHKIEHLLHSISFVPKESCRAIQLADLLAFYSRRDSAAHYRARENGAESYQIETMIKIITENLPHRGFVATDFGPEAKGRPF